jgi:hypothetical protein
MDGRLHNSVDFERTPEFRTLARLLQIADCGIKDGTPHPGPLRLCEGEESEMRTAPVRPPVWYQALATFICNRLWVELGYLAKTTNRPGFLTADGRVLFESTLEPLFGDNCNPTDLLVDAKLLDRRLLPIEPGAPPDLAEEFFCARFAELNSHLAGNNLSREKKGNLASLLTRRRPLLAQEAAQQTMLLPPDTFKTRAGVIMTAGEIQRTMLLIKTLDNCLDAPGRHNSQYTETLIADAGEVAERYRERPEELRKLQVWIMTHREHPAVPGTAEQILGNFAAVERMAAE